MPIKSRKLLNLITARRMLAERESRFNARSGYSSHLPASCSPFDVFSALGA